MASIGTLRKKTCTKCLKYLKVYLKCFKCEAIYHAKCLLKVPGFQVDQEGHAFCCLNITFKSGPAKEMLASQETLVVVSRDEECHSNKDLENCLPKEKDLETNEFKCDAYSLEFTNEEHPENPYKECPDKQTGLFQELYKEKVGLVCSFSNEANFQEESYDQHIRRCEEYYAQLKVKHSDAEKKYKCYECKYSAHKRSSLANHVRTHSNERPFKCDICDYAAASKSHLNSHTLAKHSNAEKKYKCSECEYSAHQKCDLVKHTRIHTNERPFKCDTCNYAATRKWMLRDHILARHSNTEKKYKCNDCEYSTLQKSNLRNHVRTHTKERPFKCDKCKYAATQRGNLDYHILVKHSNAKRMHKFKCDTCTYAATCEAYLKLHILAKHSNAEKRYKCSVCKYSAHQKSDLVKHIRIHSNERPFKCNTCNYAALRKSGLNRHILLKHSNAEKMHKCGDCKYSTHQKSKLVGHMRVHANERLSNKKAT